MTSSIHRNTQGGQCLFMLVVQLRMTIHVVPIELSVKQNRTKKHRAALLGGLLASLAATAGAFATNNQALVAIVSTAVVYNLSSRTRFPIMSMRGMIIGLLSLLVSSFC